ncbi:MAG TPA: type I polyketide synthase [Acidimicrobiales bacterium]|nr:type I polyketide synthase [Acidimicrobiales bacterium]
MATDDQLRSYLKRVTADLHHAQERLRALEDAPEPEPIAIVGMACRYPGGVVSPEGLWDLVARQGDATTDAPRDRDWDIGFGAQLTAIRGGFLHDAGDFDAGLFSLSPREATATDPQQRLLLEVAWESLERAGVAPTSLRGSDTGVFVGLMGSDYMGIASGPTESMAEVGLTGFAGSVVSGRVAYVLGLEGPAITLDTACSSSLVALHLAGHALRAGDCRLALAGGVTVMSTPLFYAGFPALASDGRCKSFSARADGVAWSEGVGMMVLERLSDARRNGHRVWGVVRGTAVNQDGASNGLTAPNGLAQQRVIRQALANAGVTPDEVDVVEAHGTGTVLGDPIEAQAILATYGQGRADEAAPLWLGSVKSNIGHTSAAAGVAGLIKMIMAMRHRQLPATLHVDAPTPHVDWTSGRVELLTEPQRWDANGHPRRAAVSSFGISGTNAHVIVEEPPDDASTWRDDAFLAPSAEAEPRVVPLVVSAGSREALAAQARRLGVHLQERGSLGLADVGWSLATSRAALAHRGVVVAADRATAQAGLAALASGSPASGVVAGRVRGGGPGRVGFVFSGQGSQRAGMGRELHDAFPVFAECFDDVCARLDVHLGAPFGRPSLRAVLFADEGTADAALVDETVFTQAGLFAVEVALARLLAASGLRPDVVSGHSIGELVAAHVAGVLPLDDACRLVAARGRLMQALPTGGAMAALEASEDEALELLSGLEDRVSLAAANSPTSMVVSGDAQAVGDLARRWKDAGRRASLLRVNVGFHSPLVEPMLAELAAVAATVELRPPQLPLVSNMTGELAGDEVCTPGYWVRHARGAVRFGDGITTMVREGVATLFEVGPDAPLVALVHENLDGSEDLACVPTLRRGREEPGALLTALGQAWARGVAVDWAPLLADLDPKLVDIPTYAFQRERYWPAAAAPTDAAGLGQLALDHPLLGAGVEVAGTGSMVFTGRLSLAAHPWLTDHAVGGAVVMPGTALVELALHPGAQVGCGRLEELVVEAPLVLPWDLEGQSGAVDVQVELAAPDEAGHRSVAIHARSGPDAPWSRHASGSMSPGAGDLAPADSWRLPEDAVEVDVSELYELFAGVGLSYGPAFRGVQAAWRCGDEAFAEVLLPGEAAVPGKGFDVHPAALDAALHPLLLLAKGRGEGGDETGPLLPFAFTGVSAAPEARTATGALWRVRLAPTAPGADSVSVRVSDEDGRPLVTIDSLVLRPAPAGLANAGGAGTSLFTVEWEPLGSVGVLSSTDLWSVVGDDDMGLAAAGVTSRVHPDFATLTAALDAGAPTPDVVAVACPVDVRDVREGVRSGLGTVLGWVQAWLADERFSASKLLVVTRGAVAVAADGGAGVDGEAGLVQAPVWGLVSSAESENPGRFVLADVEVDATSDVPGSTLVGAASCGEPAVAIRQGRLWRRRLTRNDLDTNPVAPSDSWRLVLPNPGVLDGIVLEPYDLLATRPLAGHEVRIAVQAVGVNFQDLMVALDLVEMPPDLTVPLGGEGAGVVLEIGADVSGVAVGDRVMGLFPGAMASTVITDYRFVVPMLDGWTYAQAAAVPVAFMTAWYGLVEVADLQPGESVLVHAAAGGVGSAAVQIAHHLGAEVYATAHPSKWEALQALGVAPERISTSRDVGFASGFGTPLDRRLDVVLNSLPGDFVDASLELLADGGRFVELNKTGLRDPGTVAEAHRGVRYRQYDVWRLLLDDNRTEGAALLATVMGLFARGELQHPQLRTWQMTRAAEALRFMSQGRHVGKIVLTRPGFDSEGTVLITGGTGTLGGLVARRLVEEHGVRSLVLTSRRGIAAPGATELVAGLAASGAEVTVAVCDTTDRAALTRVISAIPSARPLRTVVHTAGVVDDGLVSLLTPERVDAVMEPKALGAWMLHEVTRDLGVDLSAFVLFSSASGVSGAAGQGNYAAANVFLDALAEHRRGIGLPGTSLAWGQWASTSGATDQLADVDVDRLRRVGFIPMAADEALDLFDAAIRRDDTLMMPIHIDLPRLRATARSSPLPSLWYRLAGSPVSQVVAGGLTRRTGIDRAELTRRLAAGASDADRVRVLVDVVQAEVAAVLGYARSEAVETDSVFKDLGFDSLTAVELRNRLNMLTGLRLPATLAFDHPTVTLLSQEVDTRMNVVEPAEPAPAPAA